MSVDKTNPASPTGNTVTMTAPDRSNDAASISSDWEIGPIVNWVLQHGRLNNEPVEFLTGLALALESAGAPVDRLRLASRTIHPQIAAWSVSWDSRSGGVVKLAPQHGLEQSDAYVGSPIEWVDQHQEIFRANLTQLPKDAHHVLHELAADGYTDYIIYPVRFTVGSVAKVVFATLKSGGFSPEDLEKFERIVPYVSSPIEVIATRRVMLGLLDTYIGPRTSARVLDGKIKRGDGDIIDAALWFSDLRDFTHLTETLPPAEILAMLNTYFELVSHAVTARGGEILRFIGDAMLIVFPAEDAGKTTACQNALDAAFDAHSALDVLNLRRRRNGEPEIKFGVGLHVGEVIYGNVGAPDRLDFTVMGPAVNRTARLEGLTKTLGRSILLSKKFSERVNHASESLGFHKMKGVAQDQEVFGLID